MNPSTYGGMPLRLDSRYTIFEATNPPPPMDNPDMAGPPPDAGYDPGVNDADYFYNSLMPYGSTRVSAWTRAPQE